ncbi:hypothetical protein D9611_006943 [Ephemerocybe angulata]|uniref:Uncharacterized protein n=1 Tax=Ephemerocybe angulata TaxID=980116 RepID=A0A8H5AZW8_9AGAR|nr:hypothetical protein D9611_006943 [Tulosesus angulatus]
MDSELRVAVVSAAHVRPRELSANELQALAALKHKPAWQSASSCVLDLQSAFAAPEAFANVKSATRDRSWRAHALQLESAGKVLKAQLDAERERSARLLASALRLRRSGMAAPEKPGGGEGALEGAVSRSQPPPGGEASAALLDDGGAAKKKGKKKVKKADGLKEVPQPTPPSGTVTAAGTAGATTTTTMAGASGRSDGDEAGVPSAHKQLLQLLANNDPSRDLFLTGTPTTDCAGASRASGSGMGSGMGSGTAIVAVDRVLRLVNDISEARCTANGAAYGTIAGQKDGCSMDAAEWKLDLDAVVGNLESRYDRRQLLVASLGAALDAVSVELGSALGAAGGHSGAESVRVCGMYAVVLQHLVSTVLPVLLLEGGSASASAHRSGDLDDPLHILAKRILVPCIQAFLPLSLRLLVSLREGPAQDVRPAVLSLLQKVCEALFKLGVGVGVESGVGEVLEGMRMALVLRSVAELRRVVEGGGGESGFGFLKGRDGGLGSVPSPGPGPAAYERRLARKDAVWYLCSVLHLLSSNVGAQLDLSPSNSSDMSRSPTGLSGRQRETGDGADRLDPTREVMRCAIVDAVLGLVSRCRGALKTRPCTGRAKRRGDGSENAHGNAKAQSGVNGDVRVDESEYGMVLGVAERLFLVFGTAG